MADRVFYGFYDESKRFDRDEDDLFQDLYDEMENFLPPPPDHTLPPQPQPQRRTTHHPLPPIATGIVNPYSGSDPEKTALASFLATQSHTDILRHFMGFPIPNAPAGLETALLIGLDAEWWEKEPKPLTELGVAQLQPSAAIPYGTVGAHAENIFKGLSVMHARVKEYAHLRNRFRGAGDPEIFHFGTSTFIDVSAVGSMLTDIFLPSPSLDHIDNIKPVIFIGHAVDSDFEKIQEACGVDLLACGSIVKVIDTQVLAKENNIFPPKGANISLKHLLQHFHISPQNLHMAGNDIAYTMIAAVLTALNPNLYPAQPPLGDERMGFPKAVVNGRNVKDVMLEVMQFTKLVGAPLMNWGQLVFCTRCDRDNHFAAQCRAFVSCEDCAASDDARKRFNARTHKTEKCVLAKGGQ